MNSQRIDQFQKEMDELFQRKTTVMVETARLGAADAYSVKIHVVGLPYKIRGFGRTIDEAEEAALNKEFELRNKALKNDLFPTKDRKEYKQIELTKDEIKMIFDPFEELPDEIVNNYQETTVGLVTKLENNKTEFIIENQKSNMYARATLSSETFARRYAIYTARHIAEPELVIVNEETVWGHTKS